MGSCQNYGPLFLSCLSGYTLQLLGDNITHYRTESVHFWGLMNSATKFWVLIIIRGKPKLGAIYFDKSDDPRAMNGLQHGLELPCKGP